MNLRRFPIDDISGWTDWIHGSDYAGATDTAVASTKGLGGMLATSGAVTWPAPAPAVLIWGPDSTLARTAYPLPATAGPILQNGLEFSPDGSRLYAIAMQAVGPVAVELFPIYMKESSLKMSGPSKVTLGNRLTFRAHLKGAATGSSVTFFDSHGPIDSCSTDTSGHCSIALRPTASFYIHALFPGSSNIGSSETPWTLERVRVVVVGQMTGQHARTGRYALYRTGHAVHYRTSVTPPQPGGSMTAVVETKVSTRWQWVNGFAFTQSGRGSRTILVTRLTGGSLLPGTYRIHSTAAGQGSLFGNRSRWVYFKVG
jgi:hypothetical protein